MKEGLVVLGLMLEIVGYLMYAGRKKQSGQSITGLVLMMAGIVLQMGVIGFLIAGKWVN